LEVIRIMRLKGKVAIVTGSGSGIGKGICELFAKEGAKVVVSSRRATNGQPVADNIKNNIGDAVFIKCDISKKDDIDNLFKAAVKKYGAIDILVNNAGVNFVKEFAKLTVEDWDRVINTDLRGTFICSKNAVDTMLKNGGGSIVNIATVHTYACVPGAVPYDAAKWGMVGLTKSMAVELADKNIRVNTLSPGLIDTQIWEDIQDAAEDKDACLRYWKANIPMGRVGSVKEVAYLALYLASDEASYVTGSNFFIDGGMTSQLISRADFKSNVVEGKGRQ